MPKATEITRGLRTRSEKLNPLIPCNPSPRQDAQLPFQQLDLLEQRQERRQSLHLEVVPIVLRVGDAERFALIHSESELSIPGQFSQQESDEIIKATADWDWRTDEKTRIPACSHYLLALLEATCSPKKASGVSNE